MKKNLVIIEKVSKNFNSFIIYLEKSPRKQAWSVSG